MSIFIDRKYILQISSSLRNFKQKKDDLFVFSCIFCGDSKKKMTKARGYVFPVADHYIFKCHNCQYTTNLGGLIKHVNESLYSQYLLETFNNSHLILPTKITQTTSVFNESKTIPLEPIGGLPDGHYAKDYVLYRKIPERFWSRLYFAECFQDFVSIICPKYEKSLPNDPRLVIPFYNEYKVLCGFQGRSLRGSEIRYITIKISDDALKLFGMDIVNLSETIYVLEGPIDSMFLPNAVATCDSDLSHAAKFLPKDKLVLVYDNQYWHKEIKKQLNRSIENGFNVCIFSKEMAEKDINEIAINKNLTEEQIKSIVDTHTFCHLRAKLELSYHG